MYWQSKLPVGFVSFIFKLGFAQLIIPLVKLSTAHFMDAIKLLTKSCSSNM